MGEMSSVSLLTNDLLSRWKYLLGEVKSSTMSVFESEQGKALFESMRQIHNKLAMATTTQDRTILSVTGLQGVGKTTIVKRLYDLDDRFLPENDSRGEQLPVLITESKVSEPQGYVCRSTFIEGKGFQIVIESVSPGEFKRLAKDPGSEDIWLELKVPNRYFFDEKKSFALLPGFEQDEKERSQILLKHLLYLSVSSLVVFNKDTYPRQSNENMLRLVKDLYTEVRPIFVLTRGDENAEKNDIVRQQVGEDFHIDENEKDRIVISGVYNDETKNNEWKQKLIKTIQKYSYLSAAGEKKQQEMIDALCMDIRRTTDALAELLKKQEESYLAEMDGSATPERTLNQFEQLYEGLLLQLERDIKEKLQQRLPDARDYFNKFVKENTGFWKTLGSKFYINALEEQIKLEKAIKEAWTKANNALPERDISETVADKIEVQSRRLKLTEPPQQKLVGLGSSRVPRLDKLTEQPEPVPSHNEVLLEQQEHESITRINQFFGEKKDTEIVVLKREDLQVLTVMGTMLCKQVLDYGTLMEKITLENGIDEWKGNLGSSLSPMDKTVNEVSEQMDKLQTLVPKILKSIPLVLGVDVVVDGQADLLVNATTALNTIGIALTPLQLVGIIGGAFALAYGVNAVQKAVHETNQYQLKLAQAGYRSLDMLPEIQTQSFITSLRRVFEKMGEQLLEKHHEEKGVFDEYGQLEKMQYSVRHIKKINGQLQKLVYNHAAITV
jgi:hypothetical protein